MFVGKYEYVKKKHFFLSLIPEVIIIVAVNYYANETEFKEKTARNFDATTPISTIQIKVLLDQLSSQLDAIMGEAEGHMGTDETCPEWAKQAVLSAAKMIVDAKSSDDIKDPSEEDIIKVLKDYAEGRSADEATRTLMTYNQKYPNSSGKW